MERRTRTRSEGASDVDEGFTLVQNKKQRKSNSRQTETHHQRPTQTRFNKYKVESANASEAYRNISHLTETNKGLRLTAKPNLKSEWVITPLDEKTYMFLKTYAGMKLTELKYEEKTKKAIVVGYSLNLPEVELTKHQQIITAVRMKNKEGTLTKTMLCTFIGKIPEKVDLGQWGKYTTKPYYPEPLRCFNCQRYGHHKSDCNAPSKCAVCSGRHETDMCINKHKSGEETFPKCPNCKQQHPAWSRRCPARLNRIQAALPKEQVQSSRKEEKNTPVSATAWAPVPAPRKTYYTKEQLERARSLSRTRETLTVSPEAKPRTIFLNKVTCRHAIMEYTRAVLQSVGLETAQSHLKVLSDVLMKKLVDVSIPNSSNSSIPVTSAPPPSLSSHAPIPSSVTPTPTQNPPPHSSSIPNHNSNCHPSLSSIPTAPAIDQNLPPNPASSTHFPNLVQNPTRTYPYTSFSFTTTSKPFLPTTSVSDAARIARLKGQISSAPSLKQVSFEEPVSRGVCRDPRLMKEQHNG